MKKSEQFLFIAVEKLLRGKYQPRNHFAETALQELAASIQENGIIEPIIVRPLAHEQYEIIAGERRWRAAQLAALDTVPCVIRHDDDRSTAAITLIENIQREDLNPMEEANAFQRLLKEFNYTHEELADILGKNRTVITNKLRLLTLDVRVQDYLKNNDLKEGHARVLAGCDQSEQYPLAKQCVEKGWSVRKLEQVLKKGASPQALRSDDINRRQLEKHLSDYLGTDVRIEQETNEKSGYLKIRFHDADIFSGIVARMGANREE